MQAVSIFIAYSHNDRELKDKLRTHLKPLLPNRAEIWDDYDIAAGQNWDESIKENLLRAEIVLLLVSPDALASDYFYGQEVRISLERHARKEAVVVPVILRPCQWQLTPLSAIEALPDKGKPVTEWGSTDAALNNVAEALDKIIARRLTRQKAPSSLHVPPQAPAVAVDAPTRTPAATSAFSKKQGIRLAVLSAAVVAALLLWQLWPKSEERAWQEAQNTHTIPAYLAFLREFQAGKYAQPATDSVDRIQKRVNNYLNDAELMRQRVPKDAIELLRKARQLNPNDDRIRQLQNQIEQ